jgi:5-methylcytosine-specific restriction enzyme subunit McrC
MGNRIQVFEHGSLAVKEGGLRKAHFDALVRYNERHGNRFFAVGLNRIHFRNYVGVIQVGNLTIEILPKADKETESDEVKKKWQKVLIDMLHQAGFVRVETLSDAHLRLCNASLLDLFFESFLAEVDELAHHGLVRKYRQSCGSLYALKGRLLFRQQIAQNLVHRERFFTAHILYDRDNPFNQILRAALDVLLRVSPNPHLVGLAACLMNLFEDCKDIAVTDRTFERLPFTRNTERYRRALQLARLILLNYCPDVRGGSEKVLAILFDMNALFERFVYAQLKREEAREPLPKVTFKAQARRLFWKAEGMQKTIRPDIIARIENGTGGETVVMDTKWKIPRDGKPGDGDLQQMHAYNVQFGARRSLLIYPKIGSEKDVNGTFSRGEALPPSFDHRCGMVFLDLFEGGKLRRDLGKDVINRLCGAAPGSLC